MLIEDWGCSAFVAPFAAPDHHGWSARNRPSLQRKYCGGRRRLETLTLMTLCLPIPLTLLERLKRMTLQQFSSLLALQGPQRVFVTDITNLRLNGTPSQLPTPLRVPTDCLRRSHRSLCTGQPSVFRPFSQTAMSPPRASFQQPRLSGPALNLMPHWLSLRRRRSPTSWQPPVIRQQFRRLNGCASSCQLERPYPSKPSLHSER